MRHATPRVTRGELVLLAALVVWGLFPVVLLLIHAAHTHTRLTGADGLIGADGELGGDQLQYLAWIRDASAHGLAADLFRLTDIRRVYLQPLFTISGGLYRLGVPLSVAYWVFKPVAIVALGAGAIAWARRMFGDQAGARAATVALSLFLGDPGVRVVRLDALRQGRARLPPVPGRLRAARRRQDLGLRAERDRARADADRAAGDRAGAGERRGAAAVAGPPRRSDRAGHGARR